MRNLTKMTLANRGREDGMRGNYEPENRRDSRGRYAPKYEMENTYGAYNGTSGRTSPTDNYESNYRMKGDGGWVVKPIEDNYGPENRRDRMGRYAPRNESAESWMPPYWENRMEESRYRMGDDGGRMIGFDGGDMRGGYRMEAHYGREDELGRYRKQKHGHAHSEGGGFDRKKAQEWTREMKNADGSSGEHWTFEQTSQAMKQRGVECDPVEFYATMNMLWSDYGAVAKKYGVDKLEFWAELSKAFLMDEDAEEGKLERYYECIVK